MTTLVAPVLGSGLTIAGLPAEAACSQLRMPVLLPSSYCYAIIGREHKFRVAYCYLSVNVTVPAFESSGFLGDRWLQP
jgi:hypothetical protein